MEDLKKIAGKVPNNHYKQKLFLVFWQYTLPGPKFLIMCAHYKDYRVLPLLPQTSLLDITFRHFLPINQILNIFFSIDYVYIRINDSMMISFLDHC